jgi:hypothetical protein
MLPVVDGCSPIMDYVYKLSLAVVIFPKGALSVVEMFFFQSAASDLSK